LQENNGWLGFEPTTSDQSRHCSTPELNRACYWPAHSLSGYYIVILILRTGTCNLYPWLLAVTLTTYQYLLSKKMYLRRFCSLTWNEMLLPATSNWEACKCQEWDNPPWAGSMVPRRMREIDGWRKVEQITISSIKPFFKIIWVLIHPKKWYNPAPLSWVWIRPDIWLWFRWRA
jgi:hypothetical protein